MRRPLIAASAALLALAMAGPAVAAGPDIQSFAVDDTAVFAAGTRCPFELHGARSGTLTVKQWIAADGTLVRETDTWSDGRIIWSNPATGKSVTVRLAGPFIYEDHLDGTAEIRIPGNDQAIVVKGGGFLVGRTGLVVYAVDPASGGIIDVEKLAGHQDALWPAGCAALR
jgi:hypothetical protein